MEGPNPILACGKSWRTAVASTWADEWRSTSSACGSLSVRIATFMRSGSGRARSHTCPSTRAATAALARPGPIALARSAAVAPAGNRFSLPSGSVTRISDATIGSVRGLVGRRGRGGGGERRQGARVAEVQRHGERDQHADRDPPDHAARGQNVRFVGHMGDILVGRRRQGHGRVVEDGGGWWRPRRCTLHHPPRPSTILPIIRNAAARFPPPPPVRPARRRGAAVPALARRGRVHGPRRRGARAVRDRHAPAQHHGDPAHGPGPQQRDPGRVDPLRTHARPRSAVAPRNRPRGDRHPERRRATGRQRGQDPVRPRARQVRRAGVAVRAGDGPRHPRTAQGDRLLVRLEPDPLHVRRSLLALGARGVRAPVGGKTDLPRAPRDPLVPALSHRVVGRGSRIEGHGGQALLHPLPRGGRPPALPQGRSHAPRAAARGHGRGGQPQGCPPRRLRGESCPAPDCGHLDSNRRGRGGRSHVWNGVREGDARARCDRLRHRPAAQAGDAAGDDRGRTHGARDAGAETARGPRPVRGARADRGYAEGAGPPREDRAAPARAAALLPLRHDRRAAALGPMVREDAAARRAGPRRLSPQRAPDLARFYPGHTLVTAPEILFFWVARMLMSGYHFMDDKPFATVYLHGTVRDTQHRKMSKSLGNGIDPLDVVRLYGADALRWTLVAGSSLGADVILDPNDLDTTFAPGRNFANKLWNIGRFILAQLPENVQPIDRFERHTLPLADRWILMRANDAVHAATGYLEQFKLDEAAKRCYEFVWGELADWYVEAVKPRLAAASGAATAAESGGPPAGAARDAARAVLAHCFDTALRLLHPVVPFITEELWQKLPGRKPDELLATANWPTFQPDLVDSELDLAFLRVKQAVEKIR